MKKILIILLVLLSSITLSAEEGLTITELLNTITQENLDLQIAKAGSSTAYQGYLRNLAAEKPNLSFVTDSASSPLYGYTGNIPSYSSFGVLETRDIHTLSAGLALAGSLPGGGRGTLALQNSMKLIKEESDPLYLEQAPTLLLSLSQPLLVNGKFIDTEASPLNRRLGQIGWERAVLREREIKNRIIHNSLILFHQIISLRETVIYLEEQLKLFNLELAKARENRGLGRISETDLLSLELRTSRQETLIFDTKYQLLVAEETLAGLIGKRDLASLPLVWEYSFSDPASERDISTVPQMASLRDKLMQPGSNDPMNNPGPAAATLALEEQRIRSRLSGLSEGINMDLSFRFSPQYPQDRETPEKFLSSITDLFDEQAKPSLSLGLSLRVPLYEGGAAQARRSMDSLAEKTAALSLEKSRREISEAGMFLLRRLVVLEDKISFLSAQREYDGRLLEKEKSRLSLGLANELDVETVRLALNSRQREMDVTEREWFLTLIEYQLTAGEDLEEFIKTVKF